MRTDTPHDERGYRLDQEMEEMPQVKKKVPRPASWNARNKTREQSLNRYVKGERSHHERGNALRQGGTLVKKSGERSLTTEKKS